MKQQITYEQLNELTQKQKEKLSNFMWHEEREYPKRFKFDYSAPGLLINIGQMIEFLDEYSGLPVLPVYYQILFEEWRDKPNALCDALWEAVKAVLDT